MPDQGLSGSSIVGLAHPGGPYSLAPCPLVKKKFLMLDRIVGPHGYAWQACWEVVVDFQDVNGIGAVCVPQCLIMTSTAIIMKLGVATELPGRGSLLD